MRRWLGLRLLQLVPTFLGITFLTFLVARLAPGDPLQLDPDVTQAVPGQGDAQAQFRAAHGLDQPLPVQYAQWLGKVVRLDFGRSLHDHRPVREKLLEALPTTALLSALALLAAWAVAIPLGVRAAARPEKKGARVALQALDVAYALPAFWVAVMALLWLGTARGVAIFPLQGLHSDGEAGLGDLAWHLVLPVLCLTYPQLAVAARQVASAMREVLGREFIRAARARGVPERRVVWRHGLRNAALPLLAFGGLSLPHLVGGSVVVERIFGIPGMGLLAFDAVAHRDYPTVMGATTLLSVATLLAMLGVDLVSAVADPRLRAPRGAK